MSTVQRRRSNLDERTYNEASFRARGLVRKAAVATGLASDSPAEDDRRSDNATLVTSEEAQSGKTPAAKHEYPAGTERPDGKIELSEDDVWHLLGYSWPTWKKWYILSVIFAVQTSMNFNASVYGNAVKGLENQFNISAPVARIGQGLFLICYGFGCELWAPWSEQFGRKWILQASLFLVNIWQLPAALAPNYASVIAARILGGFSSAGGSVTLGMVADFYTAENHGYGLAFVVFSSVFGSTLGPIVGGFIEQFSGSWRWIFWIQLIFGGAVQLLHLFTVPETRSSILITREARRRRKAGESNVYSSAELEPGLDFKRVCSIWARPFVMFAKEPIVLFLSLLSGFSDALIFTFLEGFTPVFKQWDFNTYQLGLAFVPIALGYVLAYAYFIPFIYVDNRRRKRDSASVTPERRLYPLLFTVILEPIGLLGFAWVSSKPAWQMGAYPDIPWVAPMIFACLIGIANYAIYQSTIDYMVAAYGPYSASATGGNGFARDVLAGIAAFYSTPLYENIGPPRNLNWASTFLGCVAILVALPAYWIYWKGPEIRKRSKFAQSLADERESSYEKRSDTAREKGNGAKTEHVEDAKNEKTTSQA